ncbi:D-alanine--D-alanine ligase [Candidatus Sumerlaeota bacterium]|nr:D-alanine--D-alanine ligase [Candidatus Sumerlaeota bacterium]
MSTAHRHTDRRLEIWLLCGGQSPEHEVSLSSARTCACQMDLNKYRIKPVCITRREGIWLVPERYISTPTQQTKQVNLVFDNFSLEKQTNRKTLKEHGIDSLELEEVIKVLRTTPPALVFVLLHGPYGEDGTVQALLDFVNVPYTGSGVLASALAMDKIRCQEFLRANSIPTPPSIAVRVVRKRPFRVVHFSTSRPVSCNQLWDAIVAELTLPVIVKPSRCGSSVGMTIVEQCSHLLPALKLAAEFDDEILIEKFINGIEVTCGVIEQEKAGRLEPVALPLTEIIPVDAPFFDYDSKYIPGKSQEITPARIPSALTRKIQELSLSAVKLIGFRDMARVDFIIAQDGTPYLLEINTIPGMTPTSLLPQGAQAKGIRFPRLLDIIIHSALLHRKKTHPPKSETRKAPGRNKDRPTELSD